MKMTTLITMTSINSSLDNAVRGIILTLRFDYMKEF